MIPTTVARLDNCPGFLISVSPGKWYVGEALPGDVVSVLDAVWIYGQYYVCAAEMSDGTYTIFQSRDNGYSWVAVVNTNERINCILRIDYGHGLIATSDGWWETQNAGTTWTKISSQAPGCFCVKELTSERLVAIDGTYVWWSIDKGQNWTKAKVAHVSSWSGGNWNTTVTNTDLIAKTNDPSIDGTVYDLLLGVTSSNAENYDWLNSINGPVITQIYTDSKNTSRMLYSSDGGVSFYYVTCQSSWALREYMQINTYWNNGYYPAMHRDVRTDVITDIEMTHLLPGGFPIFVVQVRMASGLLRHYYVRRLDSNSSEIRTYDLANNNAPYAADHSAYWAMFEVIPEFDALASQSDSLTSEEVMTTGSNDIQSKVLFSGRTADNKPLMKSSVDFGRTWIDENVINATIYTGPDMAQLSSGNNPFTEDTYLSASFSHGPCHNYWTIRGLSYRRFVSFDADILFRQAVFDVCYLGGFKSVVVETVGFDADYITQKIVTESMLLDFVSKKEMSSVFIGKYISRDTFDSSVDDDLVVVTRRYLGSDHDMIAQKAFNAQLGHRAYVRGTLEHGTGSNIVLAQTHFPEIYVEMERGFPQQWDIPSLGRESKLPYKRGVMDTTRTEEE